MRSQNSLLSLCFLLRVKSMRKAKSSIIILVGCTVFYRFSVTFFIS